MSHFAVGVICESPADVDNLLAPYSEHIEVDPYVYRTKEQMIAEAKERARAYHDDSVGYDYLKPFTEAKTDEEFYQAEINYWQITNVDEDGNELTTYNPKSKWDWYSIGGRWADELRVRITEENDLSDYAYDETDEFVYCDEAKIKDIDFSMNKERYDECLQWWKSNIEAPDDEWEGLYRKGYYTETYESAEEYATRCASFSTFALVTPDGEWHEKGAMGWFACSDETPEAAREWDEQYMSFIENADPEYYFVMVDCHI